MANGNGNGAAKITWNVVVPVGALGLLGALMLDVSKDAAISLDVARQHGEELLIVKGEMLMLKQDVRDRTQLRYTSKDAARDALYLQRDIDNCMTLIKDHKAEHSE